MDGGMDGELGGGIDGGIGDLIRVLFTCPNI
jgi:hypothetical protein